MKSLLDAINQPADLRRLSYPQLRQLAAEVRDRLITTVTTTGGHLASNLGVVELTIALHRVFASPDDKIVWDVGHQSYVHKLLTGRREKIHTLRQHGGLCGFTDRSESPHDAFGAGHASTSLSAALGIAKARDMAGEDFHVVAVIGDGALTGGMAYEALNHAGHARSRMIVVLNDNGMSISPTVGALSQAFNSVRFDDRFRRAKRGAKHAVAAAPLGEQVWGFGGRVKDSLKRLIFPTMWEELGFIYIGPVDGHDMPAVEAALKQAQNATDKPVVVHVITRKGKGYDPAEQDAVGFHGVPPQRVNGDSGPSYSSVFSNTVRRMLSENPKVVVVTAAMGEGNHLGTVGKEFPDRVIDVGICEQHAVTFAAGLAARGFIPVVAIYSTFLQRAFDQLVHDVCLQDLHVVFALDRAGIVGDDGKTHQGAFDLSYLSLMPNMIVSAPKDEDELQHIIYTATRCNHPMAIRYPRGPGPGAYISTELRQIPIGSGELLRPGTDVCIVAIGSTVAPAMAAAEKLSSRRVQASVVNARFAKPLDEDLIADEAYRTGMVIVVEENVESGGLGSAVATMLQQRHVAARVACIGIPDEFVEHGPQELLRSKYRLDADGITQVALSAFPEMARSNVASGAAVSRTE